MKQVSPPVSRLHAPPSDRHATIIRHHHHPPLALPPALHRRHPHPLPPTAPSQYTLRCRGGHHVKHFEGLDRLKSLGHGGDGSRSDPESCSHPFIHSSIHPNIQTSGRRSMVDGRWSTTRTASSGVGLQKQRTSNIAHISGLYQLFNRSGT